MGYLQLIEGFTLAVCELPAEQRTQALNTLLMPVIQPLVLILDATPEGQTPPSEQLLPYIDRLTVIVKYALFVRGTLSVRSSPQVGRVPKMLVIKAMYKGSNCCG